MTFERPKQIQETINMFSKIDTCINENSWSFGELLGNAFYELLGYVKDLENELRDETRIATSLQDLVEQIASMVTLYNPQNYQDQDGNFDHEAFADEINKEIKRQMKRI